MPINPKSPGVYIQEVSSGDHMIAGASTSQTAFIDYFRRGPTVEAGFVASMAEFENLYGGLDSRSESSYQIAQFFLNGGVAALVVRIAPESATWASVNLSAASPDDAAAQSRLSVSAASPGAWGNNLRVMLAAPETGALGFRITVQDTSSPAQGTSSESFDDLSFDPQSPQYCFGIVNASSRLVRLFDLGNGFPNPFLSAPSTQPANVFWQTLEGGLDGAWDIGNQEFSKALIAQLTGAEASLADSAPNLLCLPATAMLPDAEACNVMVAAQKYCDANGAFYIADIPDSCVISNPKAMVDWLASHRDTLQSSSAAVYYPWITILDPLNGNARREVGTSGTMAGIYAATDQNRGVWKAPAGADCVLAGAEPVYLMQDSEDEMLSSAGINAIRKFPVYGTVSWGARTVQGADDQDSDYKYIPVRRTALYIEKSLDAGLAWCVFEPNAPPLWSAIERSVGSFMNDLFLQGAVLGATPAQAYFVRCDATTTAQTDVAQGIVNIVVGFAPVKPAEFIIIQIQQLAGSCTNCGD